MWELYILVMKGACQGVFRDQIYMLSICLHELLLEEFIHDLYASRKWGTDGLNGHIGFLKLKTICNNNKLLNLKLDQNNSLLA